MQPAGSGEKSWEGVGSGGAWAPGVPQQRGMLPKPCSLQPWGRAVNPTGSFLPAGEKLGEGGRKINPEVFKLFVQPFAQQKPSSVPGRPAPRVQPRVTFVHVEL